jgi:hypothetical protein
VSKRKTGQAVSLFPFLAVLVSAMGALILLLLVTTRKLHQDAVTKAKAEKAAIEARQAADAESARNLTPLPLPEDHPAFQTDAALFVIAVKSPSQHLLPPPSPPDRTFEKEQLRREWEDKLSELREKWDSLQQRLREAQRLLGEREASDEALEAELARLQEILNKLRAEKGEVGTDKEKVQTTKKSIAQQIAELQAELERLKSEKLAQADKFQLVPYSGNSPSRSRPIIIECDEKSLRFASEEIALTPRDLSGFTNDYNPLRAGTEALLAYWDAQRLAGALASLPQKPYLLFVIRPGGTVSYYIARGMLEKLECESGYELVPASSELVWPVTTPEAKEACQTAIDEVLGARRRLIAKSADAPLPITGELQFEGPTGEFIFHEVEQLRRPQSRTFMGSERITRSERPHPGGIPAYAPPTAPEHGGFVGPKFEDMKDEFGRPARPKSLKDVELAQTRPGGGRPMSMEPRAPGQVEGTGPRSVGEFLNEGDRRPSQTAEADQLATSRSEGVPSTAREPLGQFAEAGRGEGAAEGEATSQHANGSPFNDLLSRNSRQRNTPQLRHKPPTNGLEGPEPTAAQEKSDPRAHSQGDRTEVHETTDDPSKTGDWNAEGVVGGKGTFNGQGTSTQPAPDNIPVQEGTSSDPIAKHLPRPLPEPAPSSIAAERFVVVTVDSSSVKFGRHEIHIDPTDGTIDIGTEFSVALKQQVSHWGPPPKGFHWQPALRYRVRPGGNQYYAWLQSASREWGMRSTVEYVFD